MFDVLLHLIRHRDRIVRRAVYIERVLELHDAYCSQAALPRLQLQRCRIRTLS